MKNCISCGMPMSKPGDYPQGDESKEYCVFCARPDGSMQSYEEKLDGMTDFIVRTQGFAPQSARESARALMALQPAWKNRQ